MDKTNETPWGTLPSPQRPGPKPTPQLPGMPGWTQHLGLIILLLVETWVAPAQVDTTAKWTGDPNTVTFHQENS